MSGSVNRVIIVGHLGADPECRRTQAGSPVVNLRIATSETWRDKNSGERKERKEWHRVIIWNEGLCKVAEQYLKKGSLVYIEGQLQTRKWTDQQNVERYSTEIVLQGFNATLTMLDSPKASGETRDRAADYAEASGHRTAGTERGGSTADDEEIPFAAEWRG